MGFLGASAVLGTTTTYHRRQTEPKGRTHFFLWALFLGRHAAPLPRHPSAQLYLQRCYSTSSLFPKTQSRYRLQEHPCIRTPASTLIVSYRTVYSLHSEIFFSRPLTISVSLFNLTSLYKKRRVRSGRVVFAIFFFTFLSYHFLHITFPILTRPRPNMCPQSGSEAETLMMTCLQVGSHIVRLTYDGHSRAFQMAENKSPVHKTAATTHAASGLPACVALNE